MIHLILATKVVVTFFLIMLFGVFVKQAVEKYFDEEWKGLAIWGTLCFVYIWVAVFLLSLIFGMPCD